MHTRPRLRPLICLWALWFGVAIVEPAALQLCPMHGAHAGHSAHMPVDATSHSADHGAPSHHSNRPCTCLGACCVAPTLAIPMRAVAELPAAPIVILAVDEVTGSDLAPVAALPYAHPFANGPPTTRSA